MLYLRLLKESFLFAWHALVANKLRTFLSLSGITVGIFAIISVFTMVDSMEKKIRDSISSLGDNIIYIQKWPWSFGSDYPWWKYWQRPLPKPQEADEIRRRSTLATAVAFQASLKKTVSYQSNIAEAADLMGVSHEFNKVSKVDLARGRYFSDQESAAGRNVTIIGDNVAQSLFGNIDALDREIKIGGRRFRVIGIFKRTGESMFGESDDNKILIPLNAARMFVDLKEESSNPMIMVKAHDGIPVDQLKGELNGIMRSIRKTRPGEEGDFALNEISLISQGFTDLFKIVNLAGGIIGIFSIIVGGFGIANIMFVSVKERTSIIGIQKSLGAKSSFILFQFLSEAVILCIIGGMIGLFGVFLITLIAYAAGDIEMFMTLGNILTGIGISVAIGLIAGIIPAWSASRLDPVTAIRMV